MKKRVIVISLGGSLITPKKTDHKFLEDFKKILRKNYKKYKFVVICGGGGIARKYISALKKQGKSKREQGLAGMKATRMNAMIMTQLFSKKESNKTLPKSKKEIKNYLDKNNVVFSGALIYAENETSDGTAAKLAHYLKAYFINMSNVSGLYTSNPSTDKSAKFIPKISWKEFEKMALSLKFSPGQHFVLDQNASTIIKKRKIKTYIIGKSPSNLNNLIKGKKFKGTIIEG